MRKPICVIVSCLLTHPAFAALSYVNCQSNDSGGSSVSSVQTNAVASIAGNGVYVYGTLPQTTCAALTITPSNLSGDTFIQIGSLVANASGAMCSGMWYVKSLIGNASEKYTLTLSSGTAEMTISVIQFSGQNTSSPYDKTATPGFGNVTTSVTTGTTPTLSVASEIVINGLGAYGISRTWTAGSGYTLPTACVSPFTAQSAIQYQIVSSTTALSATATVNSATYLDSLIATFEQAGAAASAIHHKVTGN